MADKKKPEPSAEECLEFVLTKVIDMNTLSRHNRPRSRKRVTYKDSNGLYRQKFGPTFKAAIRAAMEGEGGSK
jgi:hypothetical protein